MKIITTNKRAQFEYFILEKFQAGIALVGSEVKSVRTNSVSINESFVYFRDGEAYISNMYIKNYPYSNIDKLDERRSRKLLLNKRELSYLIGKVSQKGLTVVPTKLYFDRQLVKVEIALCRGKQLHDKRETIKKRDIERDVMRETR